MFKTYEFANLLVATDFLNGCVVGGPMPLNGLPLTGKTITFSRPGFTHTFTAGTGPDAHLLYPADIKSQLETASSGNLFVSFYGNRILLRETTPTTGVALDSSVEDAKALLGLAPSATGRRVYAQSSTSYPRLEAVQTTPSSVVLLTWEE